MARKFSQFRVNNKGKDRFKQTPASALLMERLNSGSDDDSCVLGKLKLGYSILGKK